MLLLLLSRNWSGAPAENGEKYSLTVDEREGHAGRLGRRWSVVCADKRVRQGERGRTGVIRRSVCRRPFVVFGETQYDAFLVGSGGKRGRLDEVGGEGGKVVLVVETARSDGLAVVKGWVYGLRDIGWCSA